MNENDGAVSIFDKALLAELCEQATESPRLRAHHNIHSSLDEPCQRMLVAIQNGSYVRPHRHLLDPKAETIFAISGSIGVICFDHTGEIIGSHRLGGMKADAIGCDVAAGVWHTIVCLEPNSVFLEAKSGPYVPFGPDDFAPWSPESDFEDYLDALASIFL
ncbi:WbuC family cupin fold metalloprotein [Novipirellula sp. SH528]|uniref:WbuC family cupin fold metalloprotein n=1 Tax=Novipirellula sp. SH528 TaxID=3454466 RepID=UPI003FA07D5A